MKNSDKTIKNIIDSRLSNITIDEEFASKFNSEPSVNRKVHKRSLAIAIAVCLCIAISIPVAAATIPSFNRILSLISPEIGQVLQPVELVSENSGIKMEVIAAMNDDDTAVAYLTFQDLNGDRVDKTIDLYDYNITGASMFTSEVIDYDEQTKTATIRMLGNGGSKLNGKKVTLRVDSFLCGKHEYNDVETGIDLVSVLNSHSYKTMPLDMNNISGGGGSLFDELKEKGTIQILKSDELNIAIPDIDFVNISNIGIVDGRLHIQTKWKESIDDHGFLFLADNVGDRINPSNVYFDIDEEGNTKFGGKYIEYIFDIDQIELEKYKILGYFVKNNNFVEGKWQSTFKLEAVEKSKKVNCSIGIGDAQINNVSISPLGITLLGTENGGSEESLLKGLNVSVTTLDGSIDTFTSVVRYDQNGEFKIKYMPAKPVDMENIKEISINGNVLEVN